MQDDYLQILKKHFGDLYIFVEKLVYYQDEYTRIHSRNVADYALLFGKELNLNIEDLELIRIGGLLHDIGKIDIPDYILNKTESLTKDEYEIIKKHPLIGEVLLPNDCPKEIKNIVRSHHERMDGTGYPDGIKGERNPYFARIIAIVDAFDAMTTQRSYNLQKTLKESLDELYKCSRVHLNHFGETVQQFDPYLVDVFVQLIQKEQKKLENFKEKNVDSISGIQKIKNMI